MASDTPSYVDPATVPLSIEQPSDLFRLPRELRDRVYYFTFRQPDCARSSIVAAPLLTCRQFYVEARAIAFANIDWRIDWDRTIRPYYNGEAQSFDGQPLLAHFYEQLGAPIPPQMENIHWSTRTPLNFTISHLCTRARLSDQQRAAIRRLTISNYWFDFPHGYMNLTQFMPHSPRSSRSVTESGLLYHFLNGSRDVLANGTPLDCITIETYTPLESVEGWDCGSHPDIQHSIRQEMSPSLAMLWNKDLSQKFVLRSSNGARTMAKYRDRPGRIHSTTWFMRLPLTNIYFNELHNASTTSKNVHQPYGSSKSFAVFKEGFDFDDNKHAMKWQWKFLNDSGSISTQPSDQSFDYIEISRAK